MGTHIKFGEFLYHTGTFENNDSDHRKLNIFSLTIQLDIMAIHVGHYFRTVSAVLTRIEATVCVSTEGLRPSHRSLV